MFVGQATFGFGATSLAQVTPQKVALWDVDQQSRSGEWDNPIFTQEMIERWNGEAEAASLGYTPAWMDLSLAYSPDGRWIATGTKESTVRLWNAQTGEQVADLGEIVERVDALAFDAHSRYLTVASGGVNVNSENLIHIWEFEHHRLLVTRLTREVEALMFHPSETTLISVGESPHVQQWNVKFPVRFMGRPVKRSPIETGIVFDYSMSSKPGSAAPQNLWTGLSAGQRPSRCSHRPDYVHLDHEVRGPDLSIRDQTVSACYSNGSLTGWSIRGDGQKRSGHGSRRHSPVGSGIRTVSPPNGQRR
jgi:WD40 repeat protein